MSDSKFKRSIPGRKDANGAFLPIEKPKPPEPFDLNKFLFDKQWKFVEDPRPFKIAVCSRRAGKTVSCAAHLIDTAIKNPNSTGLYITITRNNAKKIIWRELQKINKIHGLKGEEDLTELSMSFPNGSTIFLAGAKDESAIENFRGMSFKLVYIDECQSFRPYIEELIDDIIGPALMDHDGTLCLIGTPGAIPSGFFAEIAGVVQDPEKLKKAKSWSHHEWTFFDNPFIPVTSKKTHQQMLEREMRRRGVTAEDPTIQREWFGKWVLDSDSLWVKYYPDKNHYDELPKGNFTYILGIDLGYNDADALAVLAYADNSPTTYLVEEVVAPKQGISELVTEIQKLQKKYSFVKMVIDEGGLGKKIAEEIRRRHGIPVQMADKARKQENVALLNDSLRTKRFMAKSNSRFAQDSYLVEVDRSKSRPDKIIISDKYHSDIIDAVLYAFKESPAYTWEPPVEKPKHGTRDWYAKEVEDMMEADIEATNAQYAKDKLYGDF